MPVATPSADFSGWVAERRDHIEGALDQLLPRAVEPARLHEAMRYAVLGGGKRIRALLAFAAGEVTGAEVQDVVPAAAAVELMHAYSLVHDDLPCMDDDILRRGRPTCHVAFDEATALLVGDSLQSLAFQVLSQPGVAGPGVRLEMLHQLALAAGSRGMAGGQAMDLAATGRDLSLPELEMMHIHKTGALIRAAVGLGARCAAQPEPSTLGALDRFAKTAGLAFQVIDDVLDAGGDTATLGKTAGKDASQGKLTYVSMMGLARAREFAAELRLRAVTALDPLGVKARRLHQLLDLIVERSY